MKTNKYQESIRQLESLIDDRKSFITGDEDCDEVFKDDIKALRVAIEVLKKVSDGYKYRLCCFIRNFLSGCVVGSVILTIIAVIIRFKFN